MADIFRFVPAALESALSLIRGATSDLTAEIFSSILELGASGAIPLQTFARFSDTSDLVSVRERLSVANREFLTAFGITLLRLQHLPDFDSRSDGIANEEIPRATNAGTTCLFELSPGLLDLLDCPPTSPTLVEAPDPDSATERWLNVVAACPMSGRGHHLGLRCRPATTREMIDFASLLAARGALARLASPDAEKPEFSVLRGELHAGATPSIILVDLDLGPPIQADNEDVERPAHSILRRSSFALDESRRRALRGIRNTYVWRVSADYEADTSAAAFFGGIIGPLVAGYAWSNKIVARFAPDLGEHGNRALASRVEDPRDVEALAAMTKVATAALDFDPDEAAVFVAGSLSRPQAPSPEVPSEFDARLVVCDDEGHLLLARAPHLARHGGRVLFWGPPGGGKSTFAKALAARMGRNTQIVTGATILARYWGVTERIIADVWMRAAEEGSSLIIDEIDSLCGVREAGSSNGNAYLVRTLTNEFLRAFDTHGSVPVIATANHLEAIDEAIRRRFTFVIHVAGALTPEAEIIAWRSLLGVEPPRGWTPVGANVADYANAARRCRMLGLHDARSLAAAVERSRDARLGPRPPTSRSKQDLQ